MRPLMIQWLVEGEEPPLVRIEGYFDALKKDAEEKRGQGCMVSTLCAEANGAAEVLRSKLSEILEEWSALIALCLEQARSRGELAVSHDANALVCFILNAWQGAMIRTKVSRDLEPLETFKRLVFGSLLTVSERGKER